MTILEKIYRKMPWLAFRNFNLYLTAIFLLGLIIKIVNPFYYTHYLSLDIAKIMSGQVWRLFTFIFFPPSSGSSIILSLLMIYVYYSITRTLIFMWGNLKFNIYIIIGYFSQIFGAFIVYFVLRQNLILFPVYMTFSIIMAFALSFPDAVFLIYFFVPLKAKYFAYFEIAIYVFNFISSDFAARVAIICSAINVFIFFVILKNEN